MKAPLFEVRPATREDMIAMTEPGGLGEQFFNESEFGEFTEYDPEQLREFVLTATASGHLTVLTGCYKGAVVGLISFTVERQYTQHLLGLMYLFYVQRTRRLGPLGRALLMGAEAVARDMGACVFYAGAQANIGGGVDERLMNLLDRQGYTRLGGVSRKILRAGT